MISDTDDFSESNYCACIQLKKSGTWGESLESSQMGGVTCTALPLTSAPTDAAVAIVFGTVAVLVSQMCR